MLHSQKIISLVPSITLLLCDLGLENNIVGRTKFCIHPAEKIKKIPIIGGTKNIDLNKIKTLQPDIIFVSKEENIKEQILELKKSFKVIVFDVASLEDNYKMIVKIGKLTNTLERAHKIIIETKLNFEQLKNNIIHSNLNALYLIWKNPYMTVGKDTFIHDMLTQMGLNNLFAHQTRYPIIQNLQTSYFQKCQLVLLSTEPYPFSEKHFKEIQEQLPQAKIILADGEYFSWYGSKIIEAPTYFQQLLEKINKT
ncbi:MAG TPA: helical backbone metal receptor [Chitinophagales bacterium]|nr:helical backbone metal receptor [Chitinophagales bacterium]HQW78420.1 helical backbone metal receptor [Chitinophagales bacterium]HRB68071.1 helical backbone metal receptor [Chitinophagales bacterium]